MTKVSSRAPIDGLPQVLPVSQALSLVEGGEVDVLVNCAGRGDRRPGDRTGTDATDAIAQALATNSIPGILISTTRVLEGHSGIKVEDWSAAPASTYAEANAHNESIWLGANSPKGRLHVLRLTNFFAAPESTTSPQAQLLPWSLVREATASGTITMRSGGNVTKDFVCSDDIATAIEALCGASDAPPVCATVPGITLTLGELSALCSSAVIRAGFPEPSRSFGADELAPPPMPAGWLHEHGWSSQLTCDAMLDVIVDWVRPRVEELHESYER